MARKKITFETTTKGTRRVERDFKKIDSALVGVAKSAKAAVAGYIGFQTAVEAFDLTQQAGKLDSLRKSFLNLGKEIGLTEDSITALKEATDGTVAEFDLLQQANNALLLGIVENEESMVQLFDTAQRLGKAVGKDTLFAVESLTTGIGRQSRLMLDNLGIIVDTEKAYRDYAKAIGVATKELDDEQHKTAFITAAMDSATSKVEALGEETLDASDNIQQMKVAIEEAGIAIGRGLSPFVVQLAQDITGMTNAVFGLNEEVEEQRMLFSEQIKMYEDSNAAIRSTVRNVADLDDNQKTLISTNNEMIKSLEAQRDAWVAAEVAMMPSVKGIMIEAVDVIGEVESQITGTVDAVDSLNTSFEVFSAEQKMAINLTREFGGSLAQAVVYGQNLGDAVVSSLKAIAAELISQAAVFGLLQLFTGGSFGATTSFLSFLTGGIPGFASGGSFTVGGQGGTDSQLVAFRATPGEEVNISRPGMPGGSNNITINITAPLVDDHIVDVLNPAIQRLQAEGRLNVS